MIESGHYERDGSEYGNSVRRPERPSSDALIDHNSSSRENETMEFAETDNCQFILVQAMN